MTVATARSPWRRRCPALAFTLPSLAHRRAHNSDPALILPRPGPFISLNNLALHFSTRYDQLRGVDNLNEAVSLSSEATPLALTGRPLRSTYLNRLVGHLVARCNHLGRADDLNNAMSVARDALILRPLGHSDRSISWETLVTCLRIRSTWLDNGVDQVELFSVYAELEHVPHFVSLSDRG